jgi:hypothetical protein
VRDDLAQTDFQTRTPLWPDDAMPQDIANDWSAARIAFAADKTGHDWRFWIACYDRILTGKNIHADLLAPILSNLTKEDWLGDPALVTPLFDDVLAVYTLEDFTAQNPYGHRAKINRETDKLLLVPVEVIDLGEVIKKARRFLREFNVRCKKEGGHNQMGAVVKAVISPEIEALKRKLKQHEADPQALHDEIVRSTRHINRLIREKGHDGFSAAESLTEDFGSLASDICLLSEPVRRSVDRKLTMQIERTSTAELAMAALSCHGLEGDGEGQMRVFAALAKKVLLDPNSDIEERKMAWQFAVDVSTRAALEVNQLNAIDPANKTSIGKTVKNVADIAGAADKIGDVAQEALQEGYLGLSYLSQYIPGLGG